MAMRFINSTHIRNAIALLLIFTLTACSSSRKPYYFRFNSTSKHTSLSLDSLSIETKIFNSEEISLSDSALVTNETEFSDSRNSLPAAKNQTNKLTRRIKQAYTSDNPPFNAVNKKAGENLKDKKDKGSKVGLVVIVILALVILGAVIVNNSIPDFGSGDIFHF